MMESESDSGEIQALDWKSISLGLAAAFFIVVIVSVPVLLSRHHSGDPEAPCHFDPNNVFTCSLNNKSGLEYNFYRKSCPEAEKIIRTKVQSFYDHNSNVAPALIRLVFHDCFIRGCDASVLLDGSVRIKSEKDVIPNLTLKGFDSIDNIKERLEEVCPATLSCADIIVLAAREALLLVGAPFYPLPTGRRDSTSAYADTALNEIPNPNGDLSTILQQFAVRGFGARDTVALLGAHNVGVIHCAFLQQRLYNFTQTASGGSDPSIDTKFLAELIARCPNLDNLPEEARLEMKSSDSERFGNHYYDTLLQRRGILKSDQDMMSLEVTASWVRVFRDDISLFHRSFADVMTRLSTFNVTTSPNGNIRVHCSRIE
ncbi:peroxidase [Ranunculus cassubicifolius]